MTAKFTKFNKNSAWVGGTCGKYRFEAKLFDEGSEFGIEDGRVSKLTIVNGPGWDGVVFHYDRGWDVPYDELSDTEGDPFEGKSPEDMQAYKAIMDLLESAPKRFEDDGDEG